MRGQFERRLARIESKSGPSRLCAFSDDELSAINETFRKYLGGRSPTREAIRARGGVACCITDEELLVVVDAVKAAVRRGSALARH
jgi:hypothetical protein